MTNTIAMIAMNFWLAYSPPERAAVREALGAVESNNNDRSVGKRFEISRFQVMPGVWKSHCKQPIRLAIDPNVAWLSCASVVLDARVETYSKVMGHRPDFAMLYALWHRPSRVYDSKNHTYNIKRLTKKERDRCARFESLVLENMKGSK